ncbi:MAG: hypothetical protein GX182_09070 [Firmicutes bacterium]|mgnify:CR=1 FL=1|nr:hypothetical protein [Bacillota bacterium]
MSSAISSILAKYLCILLVGLAIKLMDDCLDEPMQDLADCCQQGAIAYALLALATAAAIASDTACSLFFAAYILGMAGDATRPLASRLRGWEESLLVLGIGLASVGWRPLLAATSTLAAVQLYDDFADVAVDARLGRVNLVRKWGYTECLLLLAISMATGALLNPLQTLLVFLAVPPVLALTRKTRREDEWVCT